MTRDCVRVWRCVSLLLTLVACTSLGAQGGPPSGPPDGRSRGGMSRGGMMRGGDPRMSQEQRLQMERRLQERIDQIVRQRLALTDEQGQATDRLSLDAWGVPRYRCDHDRSSSFCSRQVLACAL